MAKVVMLDKTKEPTAHVNGWLGRLTGWFGRGRSFLSEVRAELGRVTWPTRREVWATTVVVILISTFFGVYLYVIDLLLTYVVRSLARLVA